MCAFFSSPVSSFIKHHQIYQAELETVLSNVPLSNCRVQTEKQSCSVTQINMLIQLNSCSNQVKKAHLLFGGSSSLKSSSKGLSGSSISSSLLLKMIPEKQQQLYYQLHNLRALSWPSILCFQSKPQQTFINLSKTNSCMTVL